MADKRSLYHLAPTQTPSPQIRKQLVQGRLDESPLRGSFNPEREAVSKGYSPSVHRPKITSTTPETSSTTVEHENPRQPPSQYTEPGQEKPLFSPTAIQPSSSLSLSENEDSNTSTSGHEPLQRNDLSPSKKEVPLVIKTATSPVKVVCHSPRRSKVRDDEGEGDEVRGYADHAARVTVPSVTKFTVQHDDERKPLVGHDASISDDSLDNIKLIAGSPVDPNSSAVRVAIDHNDKENAAMQHAYNPDQYKSFMGDEHGHHVGPISAGMNQSNIRQQLFDFSVDSSTMETSTIANASVTDDKKKKKKKAGRVIPSRYMDAKKPPSAKKNISSSKRKVSFQNTSKDHSSHHDSAQLNVTAPHHNTSLKGSKIVTSTPAVGSIGVLPVSEMMAPTPILPPGRTAGSTKGVSPRVRSAPSKGADDTKKRNEEKTKKPMKMKAPLLPQKHIEQLTKQKGQEIGELSQRQLELEYARLLQWIFLESKLKSTFYQQEKDAQSQLYSMWQENEKLRREISELQIELDTKNKIAEIDEQIQLQSSGLKSIGGNLAKQILNYDQLSSALKTTCQYMPVNGVILDNQEELLAALSESDRLLGEIDGLTRHRGHKISSFSKEMDVLSKITESEVQEQGRCQELLAAASILGTQERSLQAHLIQQSLPQHFPTTSSDDHSL